MSGVSAVAGVSSLVVSVHVLTDFPSSSSAFALAGDSTVAGVSVVTGFPSSSFVSSLAGGLSSSLCVHVHQVRNK